MTLYDTILEALFSQMADTARSHDHIKDLAREIAQRIEHHSELATVPEQQVAGKIRPTIQLLLAHDHSSVVDTAQYAIQVLINQIAGEPAKPRVYIGTVWNKLERYKAEVVQVLEQEGYEVISNNSDAKLPIAQRLKQINSCQLFVGIYAHEKGGFASSKSQGQMPLSLQELNHAATQFVPCLLFQASPELSDLNLKTPVLERRPFPDRPVKGAEDLKWWIQTIIAKIRGRNTPGSDFEQAMIRYREDCEKVDQQNTKNRIAYEGEMARNRSIISVQQDMVSEIRHRFAVNTYTSAEHLSKIVLEKVGEWSKYTTSGFERTRVLDRWNEWVSYHKGFIQREIFYNRPNNFDSPLEKAYQNTDAYLESFLAYDWRHEVSKFIQDIIDATGEIEKSNIADHIDKGLIYKCCIPAQLPRKPYAAIANLLSDWCSISEVYNRKNKLKEKLIQSQQKDLDNLSDWQLEDLFHPWEKAVASLRQFLKNPAYGNCLLVMGGVGSGKTYLVTRLLQRHLDQSQRIYCLYLPMRALPNPIANLNSVESLLVDTARFECRDASAGPRWRSLQEIAEFVAQLSQNDIRRDTRLLVILDDLDLWVRDQGINLQDLRDCIEYYTQFKQVYWVIMLSEFNYHLVVQQGFARFWRQYGYVSSLHKHTSYHWIRIDTINEEVRVWKPIIGDCFRANSKTVPSKLEVALDQVPKELISNPFIAWIIAELTSDEKIPPVALPDLNYIDFVSRFWEETIDNLARKVDVDKERLLTGIYIIVGYLLTNNTTILERDKAFVYLISNHHYRSKNLGVTFLDNIISALFHMGLLKNPDHSLLYETNDLELIEERGTRAKLAVIPTWQWLSGKYLKKQLIDNEFTSDNIEDWLKGHFCPQSNQVYLQGVLEFLVLLFDVNEHGGYDQIRAGELTHQIPQVVIKNLPTYRPSVWLSASKASGVYQRELAVWLDRQDQENISIETPDDIHRYIYFLKYAKPAGVSGEGLTERIRLRLLQNHFASINTFNEGGYFGDFLADIAEKCRDGEDMARAFAYLYGVQGYIPAKDPWSDDWNDIKQLAKWALQVLRSIANKTKQKPRPDVIHRWVLCFLEETAKLKQIYNDDNRIWAKAILRCYCDELARTRHSGCLIWLETREWYRWSTHTFALNNLLKDMEEQLTTSCGTWFREEKKKQAQRDEYIRRVRTWAEVSTGDIGYAAKKVTALFLIYHTVPAQGEHSDLPVNPELLDIFEKLLEEQDQYPELRRWMNHPDIVDWYDKHRRQ